MKDKEQIIKSILKSRIKFSKKSLPDLDKQREEYQKIPHDCLGKDIFNDGIINENPNLKEDLLTSVYHQIGYLTAVKYELKLMLEYLNMTKEEIDESMKKDKEIEKQNRKYLKKLFEEITGEKIK